jgi:nicotinamidase-related amidase
MPVDLRPYLDPARCAVLVIECQEGILGVHSLIPDLARSVRKSGMLETLAELLRCARSAGASVLHCTVENRPDGLGMPANTPLAARASRHAAPSGGRGVAMAAGSVGAAILPQLGPDPHDVLVPRDHGLTVFHETGLDLLLRSMGVSTVIPTGVSINVAITGATIDAVNRGYHVVIPSDCVAGAPASYAEDALRYCLRNLAYLTTSSAVCAAWRAAAGVDDGRSDSTSPTHDF